MKRKAAIITFQDADNFGAMWQCFALQEYLKSVGFDVVVADTGDRAILDYYKPFRMQKSLRGTLSSLKKCAVNIRRKQKFSRFRKDYLNISGCYRDSDVFFCGSDQIWNFDITNGYNPVYFAAFPTKAGAVKASYAASVGRTFLREGETPILEENLRSLSLVSVREEAAAELLRPLTKQPIAVVPDPTLLIGRESWQSLAGEFPAAKNKLVVYDLHGSALLKSTYRKLASLTGREILELRCTCKTTRHPEHPVLDAAGPLDFISAIKNADFVVTDSFHGTVFSVLFQKQFVTVCPKGLGSRIENLLDSLHLTDRILYRETDAIPTEPIDYRPVEHQLAQMRKVGADFIAEVCQRVAYEIK